ncbi:PRK15319 superfamily protein (plasmid) [Chromobacterium vaccinii]|nr:PRK15319 superfamily protein [Chromobacterium vaccinii]QND87443.1 PRK15319 superfamily protein [Chromobacterium vaccinii]
MTPNPNRAELKNKFADNKIPTGSDFAQLIDAAVIGNDDGLRFDPLSQQLQISAPLHAQAAAQFDNALSVAGDAALGGKLALQGPATLNSSLLVAGPASFTGGLAIQNNLASDNLHIAQGLQVGDAAQIGGDLTLGGFLDVAGPARLHGGATVEGGLSADTLSAQQGLQVGAKAAILGDASLGGALNVAGPAVFQGAAAIQQDLTLAQGLKLGQDAQIAGAAAIAKNLDVGGVASFQSGLTAAGLAEFDSQHGKVNILAPQGLEVRQDSQLNTLSVSGDANLKANLSVADKISGHSLHLYGDARLEGDAKFDGGLLIGGASQLQGPANLAQGLSVAQGAAIGQTLSAGGLASFNGGAAVKGGLAADMLQVLGDSRLQGNLQLDRQLTVAGSAALGDSLHVAGGIQAGETMQIAGDATLGGFLDLSGPARLNGGVNIENGVNASAPDGQDVLTLSRMLNIDDGAPQAAPALKVDGNGDTALYGALQIGGALALAGPARLGGGVVVSGDLSGDSLHLSGGMQVGDTAQIGGDLTLGGFIDVAGPARLNGGAAVIGDLSGDSLHLARGMQVGETVQIGGDLTLGGFIDVAGPARLNGGAAVIGDLSGDSLHLAGGMQVAQTVQIAGDATLGGFLDLSGPARLNDTLAVGGDASLDGGLKISQRNQEKAPLEIIDPHQNSTPLLVSASGNVGVNTAAPAAQLHVVARPQREALRLMRQQDDGALLAAVTVNAQGQLAVGRDSARAALDVAGDAIVDGHLKTTLDLDVDGQAVLADARVENTLAVAGDSALKGQLAVDGAALFGSGQTTHGPATFHNDADLKSSLSVAGPAALQGDVDIKKTLRVRDALAVDGAARLNDALEVAKDGRIAGALEVKKSLKVADRSELAGGVTAFGLADLKGGVALAHGEMVHTISADPYLGEESANDKTLATQRAVKAYVDTYASPFGRGGRSWSIRTQEEFDRVFGDGSGEARIADNSTIILLPPRECGHSHPYTRLDGSRIEAGGDEWQAIASYVLRNPVRLGSGVSIVGFNEDAVRVVKADAGCRFLIEGSPRRPVSQILLQGFTFDGGGLPFNGHGGAVSLNHARDIQIHTRLIGHVARGNGGALFGQDSRRVRADNIHACFASSDSPRQRLSYGGAAYGLADSDIAASRCYADVGGAVAQCADSRASAQGCQALYGGAAYSCERLTLSARYCTAHYQGGGAYGCNDLTASGYWTGNYSSQFSNRNIAAYTGNRQWSLWRGDFIERRIQPGWHCHDL